jgi:hypothetical protein
MKDHLVSTPIKGGNRIRSEECCPLGRDALVRTYISEECIASITLMR